MNNLEELGKEIERLEKEKSRQSHKRWRAKNGERYYTGKEYIKINIKPKTQNNSLSIDDILLPYFKQGTMYKGMEVKKEYTLKELEL